MSSVITEGFTTERAEPFVVFLIGMRANRFWALSKWTEVAAAFRTMLDELRARPETGFMNGEQFFRLFPFTTCMVSYWRSFEDLERFARSKDEVHLPAWQRFYREIGGNGSVGIWHETYAVTPGQYEVFYNGMPLFGLAKATGTPVKMTGSHRSSARERLKGRPEPVPAGLEVYD